MAKDEFITIKFVCDESDEAAFLRRMKENVPTALLIAQKNKSFSGHTFKDPLKKLNPNEVGYIFRICKLIKMPEPAIIQTHKRLFARNDLKNEVNELRKKYKIIKRTGTTRDFGDSIDFSFAVQKIDDFAKDTRDTFNKFGLNKKYWEDFFYFTVGFDDRTFKLKNTPLVRVIPLARVSDGKIEYRLDIMNLEKLPTQKDIEKQFPALKSLIQEFSGIKQNRLERAPFDLVNDSLLIEKSQETYTDPETGREVSDDTSLEDRIEKVFGENNDIDISKQKDYLRKLEKRHKEIGQ